MLSEQTPTQDQAIGHSKDQPIQQSSPVDTALVDTASSALNQTEDVILQVPTQLHGYRLDQALAQLMPCYSRSQHQIWIKAGLVTLEQKTITQPRHHVCSEQTIRVQPQIQRQQQNWQAQELPIDLIYQDQELLIINKPAGLTVHPGAGQADGTLVNALKFHFPELEALPRAGLIHRLDKHTSGLLLVARQPGSYLQLNQAMQQRLIKRQYLCLVHGNPISGGDVDAAIGRDRKHRTKMAVSKHGKPAFTTYRIQQRLQQHCLLKVTLGSGRTHQIRVHMQHIQHPIVGDPMYSRSHIPARELSAESKHALLHFKRQALHAAELSLDHPRTQQPLHYQAPLPDDFAQLLQRLQHDADTA